MIALGRLVPHKRVELAVQALHDLSAEFPDLTLNIVGEGWWHTHLSERAHELGVADRVTFTGHVSDVEKHELLARSWVLAMPSVKEGWGLVIVEAGLHRTPAVAFRAAGGVTESLVDGETGLLVDDEAEFSAALGAILRDEELRETMGLYAEKHARQFTWGAAREQFAELVADTVGP